MSGDDLLRTTVEYTYIPSPLYNITIGFSSLFPPSGLLESSQCALSARRTVQDPVH